MSYTLASAQAALMSLRDQERIIENGLSMFVEVGNALMRIRDEELYREAGFDGFVEYLDSKPWGISRTIAYEQIEAAQVSDIVGNIPNSRQARELAPLMRKAAPEVVKQVYAEVVEETEGKPTASAIRAKVKEMLPSTNGRPIRRRNNKADNGVVQHLTEIKALIPKWDQSALDTLSASECRRRVQLAQVVADWLTTEFLPAHEPRVAPLSKVPT